MGNKLTRRRQVIDEKYTRPQGLYQHKDVDQKKLKKLILDSKLAPCFPGDEECTCDLEECPICFLYYPSLNRSRCCTKGICTECFLQMKTPNSTRPTQCPFCKTSNYAVEYRGVKTKEEKGMEQIEEQRVIEAKIRMRQQELQDDKEKMLKRRDIGSSSRIIAPEEVEHSSIEAEGEEIVSSQSSSAASILRQPLRPRQNRDDEFDMDLEDIMVMEAIWLSIQENGRHRNPAYGDIASSQQYLTEYRNVSAAMTRLAESSSSPSGGLASAIAALAERQQTSTGESSNNYNEITSMPMLPDCSGFANTEDQVAENCLQSGSSIEVGPDCGMVMTTTHEEEWAVDHGSEVVEVGTSYASSDVADDGGRVGAMSSQDEIEGGFQTVVGPIVPDSYEEQMMLAMAVSLAEARAMGCAPGVAWH